MTTAKTAPIEQSLGIATNEIARLEYDESGLMIVLAAESGTCTIRFTDVEGFRVLDERDLTEFWSDPTYDPSACLYEVVSGGWLEFEKSRPTFLNEFLGDVQEYLVTSGWECVSVLSRSEPTIETGAA